MAVLDWSLMAGELCLEGRNSERAEAKVQEARIDVDVLRKKFSERGSQVFQMARTVKRFEDSDGSADPQAFRGSQLPRFVVIE